MLAITKNTKTRRLERTLRYHQLLFITSKPDAAPQNRKTPTPIPKPEDVNQHPSPQHQKHPCNHSDRPPSQPDSAGLRYRPGCCLLSPLVCLCVCAMRMLVVEFSSCSLLSSCFATSEFLNLEATGSMLKAFQGGFAVGTCGYVVSQNNSAYHGMVARVSLQDFNAVAVLDLTTKNAALEGFASGFTDGAYGYVVHHSNGVFF